MTALERLFAWIGGALFAASLAVTGFLYFVRWAEPGRGGDPATAVAADAVLVTIFALHHSLFARDAVKRVLAPVVPDWLQRSFYVWIASLLLLGMLALWRPVPGVVYHVAGWPALGHAAVQAAGVWLIARAVARIDPLELAGIRPAQGRDALQVTGPYGFVRHPLYLGWTLALFGAATMTGNRLTFAALTTAYLFVAVPFEERSLRRAFGDKYAAYQRTVRWRMIPFVY